MKKLIVISVFLVCVLHSLLFAGVDLSTLYPTNVKYPSIDTVTEFRESCVSFGDLEMDTTETINDVVYRYLMCNRSVGEGESQFPSDHSVISTYTNIKDIESRFWSYLGDNLKVMVTNAVETDANAVDGADADLPDTLMHYSDVNIILTSGNVVSHFHGNLYGQQKVDEDELVVTGNMYRVSNAGNIQVTPSFLMVICIDRAKVFGIKNLMTGGVIVSDCRHSEINDSSYNKSEPEF